MAIHIKASHHGRLHRALGIPEGQPIPESRLRAALHSKNPAVRREANFAENARHWHHGTRAARKGGHTVLSGRK